MSIPTNVVTCSFNGRTHAYASRALWQWDYGQILQFPDLELPSSYQVHFSGSPFGPAFVQLGGPDGVEIPDDLLKTGEPVFAWLCLQAGEDDRETVYACQIPVNRRGQPSEISPTPAQQSVIDAAIAALTAAAQTVITPEEKAKLAGIEAGAEVNAIEHITVYEPDPTGMDGQWAEVPIVDKTVELPDWTQVSTVFFALTCDDYDDPFDIALSGLRVTSGPRWGEMVLAAGYPVCRAVATLAGGSGKSYVLRLTAYKTSSSEYYEFTGRTEAGWEIKIHTPNPFSDPLNHWEIETFNVSDRIDEVDDGVYTNSLEIGNVDELTTTDKSSLVAAINEVAGSGGGGAFWATYGTTSFADIMAAHNAGDAVFAKEAGMIYALDYVAAHHVTFSVVTTSANSAYGYNLKVTDANVWSMDSNRLALKSDSDAKYSKPSEGIPATDLASGVIPTVPAAETSNPSALGTASPGSSTKWARGDHVHPKPTPADIGAIPAPASPTSGDVLTYDGSAWGASAPSHQIPAGGNAGECLAKNSASDYDLRWRTINDWTPAGLIRTAGGTAAKVAEWSFWSDAQYPAWLVVTVGNSNTYAGAITLKVNGKGPYPIYINGAASSATNYSLPAGSYFVFFDGSKFDFRTDGKVPGDITGHADQDIAAPASPTTGDFLCWNGSAWAATTLAAWQGGSY